MPYKETYVYEIQEYAPTLQTHNNNRNDIRAKQKYGSKSKTETLCDQYAGIKSKSLTLCEP